MNTRHKLFDELDAFNPRWRLAYKTLRGAAIAAGVLTLYESYTEGTPEGQRYLAQHGDVPDTLGAVQAAQQAADSLPYNLGNIGTVAVPIDNLEGNDDADEEV